MSYKINYSIREKIVNEFDLNSLGDKIISGISTKFGDVGGEIFFKEPEQSDYDKIFVEKIVNLKPVYKLKEFLDYHLKNHLNENGDLKIFINHVEYEIHDKNLIYYPPPYSKIVIEWLNEKKTMNLKQDEENKIKLLKLAYEEAIDYAPDNPYGAIIDTESFAEAIGFNKPQMKRYLMELHSAGYVNVPIGARIFYINPDVRELLLEIENKQSKESEKQMSFSQITNSQILIQQNTTNSSQSVSNESIDKFVEFLNEFQKNEHELIKHLAKDRIDELKDEIGRLKIQLEKKEPDKSKMSRIFEEIKIIMKEVPKEILKTIFSNLVTGMLF